MLNLNTVMLGSKNPKKLASYYEKVLGLKPGFQDGDWYGFRIGSSYLVMGTHSEVGEKSKENARVIFNFETKELKEEFERMKKAGAIVVKEPYSMDNSGKLHIATFEDPDGNLFQIVVPMDSM